MSNQKSFDKYFIVIDRNTGSPVFDEQGNPVMGEVCKKDCRLDQRHADILNKGWKKSGVRYIESKEQAVKDAQIEKDKKEVATNKANKERELLKKELLTEIEAEKLKLKKQAEKKDGNDSGIDKLSKDELIKMCIDKELSTEGNKNELIGRLTTTKKED